jgi:hypothetical protein
LTGRSPLFQRFKRYFEISIQDLDASIILNLQADHLSIRNSKDISKNCFLDLEASIFLIISINYNGRDQHAFLYFIILRKQARNFTAQQAATATCMVLSYKKNATYYVDSIK